MEKWKVGNFGYAYPVCLVGANVNGKANFMAAGWFTMANVKPPQLVVSVGKGRQTMDGIMETGTFSMNLATASMVEKTDYCGMVSGKNEDKSTLFDLFYGDLKTAPMIVESPLTAECKVDEALELTDHYLVVGEVMGAYADGKYVSEGKVDTVAMEPLLLSMPDNKYWLPGENIGKAWSDGSNLKTPIEHRI